MKNRLWLIISLLIPVLLGACNEKKTDETISKIVVLDKQNILDPGFAAVQDTLTISGKYLYLIRVVDNVEKARIGVVADEYFEADTKLHPNADEFEKRGVYLFVSQRPSLVQMRTGSNLSLLARWEGITVGSSYIAIQNKAVEGDREAAIIGFIQKAEQELPGATELTGIKKYIMNDLTTFLADETEELSMPAESFYGNYILKTALKLRVKQLSAFGGWWLGYLIIFAAAFVLIWLINKLLFSIMLKNATDTVKLTGKAITESVTGLFFAVPAVGSAVLLSGARMEDQIMLLETGIPGVGQIGFSPDLYNTPTAWYLALLLFVVFLSKSVLAQSEWLVKFTYSPEKQRSDYYTFRKNDPLGAIKQGIEVDAGRTDEEANEFAVTPYSYLLKKHAFRSLYFGIVLGLAAYFFIPRAFVVAALFFWLIALFKNVYQWVKEVLKDDSFEVETDAMLEGLNRQLEENPDNTTLLSNRAEVLLAAGKNEEALRDYNHLLQTAPENHRYHYQKASALDELERFDEALQALDAAEKYGADKAEISNNRALIYQKTGKIEEAIKEYSLLIKQNAKWWLPYYNRATSYHYLGMYDKAADDYTQAIKLNPNEMETYQFRAQVLQKLGRSHEAIKDYTTLIKYNRADAESLYQRAATYMQLKQYEKAIEDYDALEEVHNEVTPYYHIADVYRNRAKAAQMLTNYADAVKDYTKLIELEGHADHYAKRAFMYVKTKEYDLAMDDANKGLAMDSNLLELLLLRGSLFEIKQDMPAACQDFKKAIKTGKVNQPEILEFVRNNCGE